MKQSIVCLMQFFVLYVGGTIITYRKKRKSQLSPLKSSRKIRRRINVPKGIQLIYRDVEIPRDSVETHHDDCSEFVAEILEAIRRNLPGVIILCGTDNLEFITADISQQLGKDVPISVVVVGSTMPFGKPGSDAALQLERAVLVLIELCKNNARGVFGFSVDAVLEGSGIHKASSRTRGFTTPLRPKVGLMKKAVEIFERMPPRQGEFNPATVLANQVFDYHVGKIFAHVNSPPWMLRKLTTGKQILHGVLLVGMGFGGIPSRHWPGDKQYSSSWYREITFAKKRGVVVGILSNLDDNTVDFDEYPSGKRLVPWVVNLGGFTHAFAEILFRKLLAEAMALPPLQRLRYMQSGVSLARKKKETTVIADRDTVDV